MGGDMRQLPNTNSMASQMSSGTYTAAQLQETKSFMIQSQQYAQKSLVVSESSNVGKRKLRASRHPIEEVEPKTTRSRDHFGAE